MNSNSMNSMDGVSPSNANTLEIPQFSFFKCPISNTSPSKVISLLEAYQLIQNPLFQRATEALRAITDKERARKFKAEHFNYITVSGIFKKRSDSSLIQHSGLITIDLDHLPDVKELKQTLLNDPYFDTELLFRSPSGDGLKWIVSIDLKEDTHLNWFLAIANYLKKTYQLEIDPSGKDISRACFICYDPDIFINPKYLV